jgi:hypothetical protein
MRNLLVLGSLIAAFVCSACTHVAPYERGRLAHPSMSVSDMNGAAAGHVYAVHEGATGGGSVAESGCGCN